MGIAKSRAIIRQRRGGDLSGYIERMKQLEVSERIHVEISEFLRRWMRAPAFDVRSEDDMFAIYGLGGEDLFDAIATIADSCGRRIPAQTNKIRTPPEGDRI